MFLERISCKFSSKIILVSHGNLQLALKDKIFPNGKGKVIGHGGSRGVDFKLFDVTKKANWNSQVRHELGIDVNDIVIGFAGSIRSDKGSKELIEAFKILLKKEEKSIKLLLVGDLDFYHTIPAETRKFADNSPNVLFVPNQKSQQKYLNYEQMPIYMSAFDILGFPTYREGLPNVVIESEALEIPVVVADVPGANNALQHKHTGLLVEVCNVEKLAESLSELVNSPQKRKEFGENGRKFVSEYFEQQQLLAQIFMEKEASI